MKQPAAVRGGKLQGQMEAPMGCTFPQRTDSQNENAATYLAGHHISRDIQTFGTNGVGTTPSSAPPSTRCPCPEVQEADAPPVGLLAVRLLHAPVLEAVEPPQAVVVGPPAPHPARDGRRTPEAGGCGGTQEVGTESHGSVPAPINLYHHFVMIDKNLLVVQIWCHTCNRRHMKFAMKYTKKLHNKKTLLTPRPQNGPSQPVRCGRISTCCCG